MRLRNRAFLAVALCAGLGAALGSRAQVVLSVSPSITSNSYAGLVTLNISGLTNGERVTIQKWLDRNGNGSIDPGEPLMDSFDLMDNYNGYAVIAGVTNVNMPFDSNPASGSIAATLNFAPEIPLETLVGRQIYQVVSPSGRFSPVTAVFTVTNTPLAQWVSGTIYSNGVPCPYAVVVAQENQANTIAGAATTDGGGNYFLALPPGSYSLISAVPGTYFDQSLAPSIALTAGTSATNNLWLTNGTVTISGKIYDTGTSNGIAGLLMTMQSGNLFAVAFTDANGVYSAAVSPSFWKIQPAKERMARRAYVLPQAPFQVDATAGNVNNANIGLPKGNALFYGRISDNANHPFANVELDGSTGGNVSVSYAGKGYSDPDGNYAVAVLGDSTNQWSCNVDTGFGSANGQYVLNFYPTTNFIPGQAVQENFVALPAIGAISGRVLSSSGAPVSGVALNANAMIGGTSYSTVDSTTDDSGNFSIAVAAGQWSVQFLNGGFDDNLDTHGYEDLTAPHWVNVPPTNAVLNLTVYPLGTPMISQPRRISPTQFGFYVFGSNNVSYTLQSATDLSARNWVNVFSFQITTNSIFLTDPSATGARRFYRVLKTP